MQIQLQGFVFRSLKTALHTLERHDKPLRSSHFFTKTTHQCDDSALPLFPTFVAAVRLVSQTGTFLYRLL